MTIKTMLTGVACVMVATTSFASDSSNKPAPSGQALAHTCAACHGTYGELKDQAFVPLARMNKEEFITSMKSFRDLSRPSSIMSHIAEGYSDEDIERMATYFASLKSGDEK